MAVASNAMIYTAATAVATAPYVSSSAYYGYVPLCRRESGGGVAGGVMGGDATGSAAESPMETDDGDDGLDCPAASSHLALSNHCLIPEASARHRLLLAAEYHHHYHHHHHHHQQQQAVHEAELIRRRNRKRASADLEPATHLKKPREEAVVTAAFTMVQEVQRTVDWPRCVMNQHHYA